MDINFLMGIIIGILVGVCFSLGGKLTRAAGKKFRNHLLQKLKHSIFFALGMIFLNNIFNYKGKIELKRIKNGALIEFSLN